MTIYDEIKQEREYQVEKWGPEKDLTVNTPMDFVGFIGYHATRWFDGGFRPYTRHATDRYRKQMIKVATLAIAAIEALDAQRAKEGHAFFEVAPPTDKNIEKEED